MAARVAGSVLRSAASVREARHRIFGDFFNPSNEATGRKHLKKALVDKQIASYYEPYSQATFRNPQRNFLWHMLSIGNERRLLHEIAEGHEQGLNDRARLSKLPPTKGKGKRATRKK
ncbi:hypothetical protein KFE25_013423 [Diacronema lutheri]|mgnify:CR=1 FL=1|uniref:Small ribosomal subunit protein mS33 n=1 Tax=Diacronema lutheri TaxID=2081491 RepID=A0A8J5XZE5_DIALT|nr:hypothetical protein KFE25_013423 [Diacronema lutheri]|mmetsp:Transcript_12562/g.39571  ORF Transcript_12562/g.39571 Transcript_12562/m.39571 type:complete len:117 (+) Transcript_12562:14-364(+)